MRSLRITTLVALALAGTLSAVAEAPQWLSGKLVSFTDHETTGTDTENTGHWDNDGKYTETPTSTDYSYVDYQVVIDDGAVLYYGTERLVFRWQRTPLFTENETVRYSFHGGQMVVIDDNGKEVKLRLVKKRIKE